MKRTQNGMVNSAFSTEKKKQRIQRRWSNGEENAILQCLHDTIAAGELIERPTADLYYEKMLKQLKFISCSVSQLKNKVKNIKKTYADTLLWRNQDGQQVLIETDGKETFSRMMLKKCPNFEQLKEIFGTKIGPSPPHFLIKKILDVEPQNGVVDHGVATQGITVNCYVATPNVADRGVATQNNIVDCVVATQDNEVDYVVGTQNVVVECDVGDVVIEDARTLSAEMLETSSCCSSFDAEWTIPDVQLKSHSRDDSNGKAEMQKNDYNNRKLELEYLKFEFEKKKWKDELDLKQQEVNLKQQEVKLKQQEVSLRQQELALENKRMEKNYVLSKYEIELKYRQKTILNKINVAK